MVVSRTQSPSLTNNAGRRQSPRSITFPFDGNTPKTFEEKQAIGRRPRPCHAHRNSYIFRWLLAGRLATLIKSIMIGRAVSLPVGATITARHDYSSCQLYECFILLCVAMLSWGYPNSGYGYAGDQLPRPNSRCKRKA